MTYEEILKVPGLSPMMSHYVSTKLRYPGTILFYRLGDFYEMFFDDAKTVSGELELTLTGKACGLPERAPMCGVPFHAADNYINRLIGRGYKVAICEQLEDPKSAKGMVKRDVIRVVTPGTNLNVSSMEEGENSYIMSVFCQESFYGVAVADITTGECSVTEVKSVNEFINEITKFEPRELLCNGDFKKRVPDLRQLQLKYPIVPEVLEERYFNAETDREAVMGHFRVTSLEGLGLSDMDFGIRAVGALFVYLKETQKSEMVNITRIHPYSDLRYMVIDSSSRRNLELTATLRDKSRRGSLIWVLDKTKTAMGSRRLKAWMEEPLIEKSEIERRLDAVEEFSERIMDRDEAREYMGGIYDLERLLCKISYSTANPRDLTALMSSLKMLPALKGVFRDFGSELIRSLSDSIDPLEDISDLIGRAIVDEPPVALKDGGLIREGYSPEVDRLRSVSTNGKQWLADMEEKERQRTGIKNLKIKYNKVFGYSIEVTKSFLDLVPPDYIRRQTLTGGERYITDELKKMEDEILNAQDRLNSLEYELFDGVRERVRSDLSRILETARCVSVLDVLSSLSLVAEQNGYVRPSVNEKGIIDIKDSRHPVVEKMLGGESFIKNDIFLDNGSNMVSIITGPNMAGKSTYMRQCALIVVMAAIGSFVPASEADICITDRIFTRVGASDDLSSGRSTFMVEMTEVANILNNATSRSLLILDEIGRGTSTYDGLSIAWAVVEFIADRKLMGAKTLFATHYHELTELEGKIDCVNNFCFSVHENGGDVVFLRRLMRGGADRSYGIEVARLAGVPLMVIDRAREIAEELVDSDIAAKMKDIEVRTTPGDEGGRRGGSGGGGGGGGGAQRARGRNREKAPDEVDKNQLSFASVVRDDDILGDIEKLDVMRMTPMEAMNCLYELQRRVKNRWQG